MIEIQSKDVTIDSDNLQADRRDFNSPDWEVMAQGETGTDCLTLFVAMINGEEVDGVNHWYRVVDTETNQVLGGPSL